MLAGVLAFPRRYRGIKELIEAFGLRAAVLPDLADSLDGHLTEKDSTRLTYGGTPVPSSAWATASHVRGRQFAVEAADLLYDRTGVPVYRFDRLLGLERWTVWSRRSTGSAASRARDRAPARPVAGRDGGLPLHAGPARVAIAADPDLLFGFASSSRRWEPKWSPPSHRPGACARACRPPKCSWRSGGSGKARGRRLPSS